MTRARRIVVWTPFVLGVAFSFAAITLVDLGHPTWAWFLLGATNGLLLWQTRIAASSWALLNLAGWHPAQPRHVPGTEPRDHARFTYDPVGLRDDERQALRDAGGQPQDDR